MKKILPDIYSNKQTLTGLPSHLRIVKKQETNTVNIYSNNQKMFTCYYNDYGIELKCWNLKRKHHHSPLGKGKYSQIYGDTFKNLLKDEALFIINLSDSKLNQLDQCISNVSLITTFFSQHTCMIHKIVSKSYARKKLHYKNNTSEDIQHFLQHLYRSDIRENLNNNEYTFSCVELLNYSNVVSLDLINRSSKKSKEFGICLRAQMDLDHEDRKHTNYNQLFTDILTALTFLEAFRLVHLDIRENNILKYNSGYKLTDFGFCVPDGNKSSIYPLPEKHFHSAPELFSNNATITHKADIWSFALAFLFHSLSDNQYNWLVNKLIPLHKKTRSNSLNIQFYHQQWKKSLGNLLLNQVKRIDPKLKSIILLMLEPFPLRRISASQIKALLDNN